MHIPRSDSQQVPVLPFEEALAASGKSGGYDTEKWLYVPDFYTEYRYILGVRGPDPLICIGINPSTARPDDLDNTLKSVQRIAGANGFRGWMMFNVYAQRATNPDDMDRQMNRFLHEENMKAFEHILSGVESGVCPAVWAAWGTIIEKRQWLKECVRDMVQIGKEHNARWLRAGKCSRRGHPHHPLYLRSDEKTCDFDIEGYLELL